MIVVKRNTTRKVFDMKINTITVIGLMAAMLSGLLVEADVNA